MSSLSKAPSSNDVSTEESGWTMYFDDFFNNNHDNNSQKCSMSLSGVASSSSSLVSDATSLVEKNLPYSEHVEEFSANQNGKRSSFKKRKDIITSFVDDTLEDTATSLSNPKVLCGNQQFDRPKHMEAVNLSQEKGNNLGQRDERKELSFNGKDSDCTELKKKGLCIVPTSMDMLCGKAQTKHETQSKE